MHAFAAHHIDVVKLDDLKEVNLEKMILVVTQGETVEEFNKHHGIALSISVRPSVKPNKDGIISESIHP